MTEQVAMPAGPVRVQLVVEASPGRPVKVTMPVMGCESPASDDVTVAVQVSVASFQSMADGAQMTLVEVGVLMFRDVGLLVELEAWVVSPP